MKKLQICLCMILSSLLTVQVCSAEQLAPEAKANDRAEIRHPVARKFRQNKWKSSNRFQIGKIDGLKEQYPSGDEVAFAVEGISDLIEVSEEAGFYVSSWLTDSSKQFTYIGSSIFFPYQKIWQFRYKDAKPGKYDLTIELICR